MQQPLTPTYRMQATPRDSKGLLHLIVNGEPWHALEHSFPWTTLVDHFATAAWPVRGSLSSGVCHN